jgi:GT2 family glycosyltransferase
VISFHADLYQQFHANSSDYMFNAHKTDPICVVVINYNSGKLLERCLRSLEAQTFRGFHAIVVDNGSTDESMNWLETGENRLRVIFNHHNIGFAAANNLAIREAETEWVALLNPDAFPEPEWLSNLMLAVRNNPDYSFFASKLISADNPRVLDGAGDNYHVSGLVWRRGHDSAAHGVVNEPMEVFAPCAAAALYRRSVVIDVGGFDEDFFCYVEDVDLGFRLRLAGHRCLYVPQAVAFHVGSATTGNESDFCVYHGHRNLVWAFVKNMPGILLWLLLPLHVLLNLLTIVWFAFQGRGGVIWRAKRDALLGLTKMWRKRQRIQEARVASIGEVWRPLDKLMVTKMLGQKEV